MKEPKYKAGDVVIKNGWGGNKIRTISKVNTESGYYCWVPDGGTEQNSVEFVDRNDVYRLVTKLERILL